MTPSEHIDDSRLFDWMADRLTESDARKLEDHLEGCQACAERLDKIEGPDDSLFDRFRQATCETLLEGEAALADLEQPLERSIRVAREEHFELNELHSSGSFGRIWLASDAELEREIAFKELLPEHANSPRMRERFRREAQITAQLEHPGTVSLYDFHEEPGRAFYTMRFVRGRTFTETIREHYRNQDQQVDNPSAGLLRLLRIFVSVCNTIAFAHSRGIIHRDIKGDNILIGDFGEAIVVDWGIAKKIDADVESPDETQEVDEDVAATTYGQRMGTPLFMAPEQAIGEVNEIGPLADVYSLGSLLYKVLTGKPPFDSDSVSKVLDAVVNQPPVPPSQRNPTVAKDLEAICLQALAKSPRGRQSSAQELGQQVEDWMADQVQQKRSAQERDRFFRLSQDMLAILDEQQRIRQVNPAAEKVLGWTCEELLGMSAVELMHPDEIADAQKNRAELIATGRTFRGVERQVRCKDGSYKWLSVNATPIPEQSAIYWVGRDITEYKQLQQRMSGLLEIMPDAVIVTNSVGTVEMVNGETLRLFGYERAELMGCNIAKFVAERSREEHRRVLRDLVRFRTANPTDSHLEFYGVRKDGSEFLAEVRHGVLESDYETLFMGSIRDISQRVAKDRSESL